MNCKHVFVVFVVIIVTVILLSWLDNLKQPVRSVNRRGLELARPSPRESEILQLREVTLMAIIIMIIDYRRRRSRDSQRLLVPSDPHRASYTQSIMVLMWCCRSSCWWYFPCNRRIVGREWVFVGHFGLKFCSEFV